MWMHMTAKGEKDARMQNKLGQEDNLPKFYQILRGNTFDPLKLPEVKSRKGNYCLDLMLSGVQTLIEHSDVDVGNRVTSRAYDYMSEYTVLGVGKI